MKSDVILQIYTFLIFSLNGIIIGTIFDIFRVLRKSFKTTDIITYIEDILFWIFSGMITIYLIFKFNNGELRAYIFIAIILGIILYMLFLSKIFININVYLISLIKKIVKILIWPIRILLNKFIYFFQLGFSFFKKIFQKSSKFIKKTKILMRNLLKIHKKEGKTI